MRTARVEAWPDGAQLQTRVFLRAEPDAVLQMVALYEVVRMVAGCADPVLVDRAVDEILPHQDCAELVLRVVDDCCLALVLRAPGDCRLSCCCDVSARAAGAAGVVLQQEYVSAARSCR